MSDPFAWNQAYSVRIDTMDEQHKTLIGLVSELQAAINRGDELDVTDRVFFKLIAYTKYHFTAEEWLMGQCDFPGLAAHKLEHELLTRRVLLFKKSYDEGKSPLVPLTLLVFLQDWLKHHIVGSDKKYGEFINNRRTEN
jgi:hemerythrin